MIKVANIIRDQHFMDGQICYHDLTNEVCEHDYFIVQWNKDYKFKYMKLINRVNVVTPDELITILRKGHYDALFIHNFLYMPLHYMDKLPKNIKVFWFAWGFDIYNTPKCNPYIKLNLLHPKSQVALKNLYARKRYPLHKRCKWAIKRLLLNIVDFKHQYHNDDRHVYVNAVKRVDYFSGVFPLEYDLMVGKPGFKAKRVEFGLRNPKDWTQCPTHLPDIGENILVGNSADINNNHLDIIDYLKKIDLGNRKLIVPLSYGGSREYATIVKDAYEVAFGDRVKILMDYMPREDYFKLLSSVGYAIFFQERQQAAGNIEELLRNGVKIFFSNTSLNYRHYTNCGCHVLSIQKHFTPENLFPLSDNEKWDNIRWWYSTNNKEYRLNVLYKLYDIIKND